MKGLINVNRKFIFIIFITLLFPTMSLYNYGAFPLLRLDFVGQLVLLMYLFFRAFRSGYVINTREFLVVSVLIIFYLCLNLLNFFYFDTFNIFSFFKMFIQMTTILLILFIILGLNLSRFNLLTLYKNIISLGFLIALYSIYQIVSFNIVELPFSSLLFNNPMFEGQSVKSMFSEFVRPTSIFKEPTHLAFFLQMVLIISVFSYRNGYEKYLGINYFKLSIIFLVFLSTLSLFAFFSLFMTFIIFLNKKTLIYLSICLVLFVIVLSFELFPPFSRVTDMIRVIFVDNDLQSAEGSLIQRLGRILLGFNVWIDNFWIGVGLNNVGLHTEQYELGSWFEYENMYVYVNLFYLQILAENGILGAIAVTILFLYIVKALKNNSQSLEMKFYTSLSLALLTGFILNQDLPLSSSFRLIYLILIFIAISKLKFVRKC